MVSGFSQAGIIAVPKHFPGYGNIKLDPHTSSATAPREYSLEKNLQPFILAYRQTPFEALMTAHITVASHDTKPATRSSYMLTTILRESMGFTGVIVSDDLEMASVGEVDIGRSAVESIQAGADLLIVTQNPDNQVKVLTALSDAVSTGQLPAERIRESYARIMDLKARYGLAKSIETR
jgi:beta-N-acetylhexosaminidase